MNRETSERRRPHKTEKTAAQDGAGNASRYLYIK